MRPPVRDEERPVESDDGGGERGVTRRRALVGTAATLGSCAVGASGLASASGVAAAQITESAVIPDVEKWDDPNLAGFMIHVGQELTPEDTRIGADCHPPGSDPWPPDEILAYNAQLIDRKQEDAPEVATTLHISGDVEIAPGQLFLINRFNRCGDGYVGITVEQIGRRDLAAGPGEQATNRPVVDIEEDERPNTDVPTGAIGPGFGPMASIAALLAGALLRRRGDDEA